MDSTQRDERSKPAEPSRRSERAEPREEPML